MSVRKTCRPKNSRRIKIIKFGFFCLKAVDWKSKCSTRTREDLRSYPYKIKGVVLLSFQNADQKSTLSKFEPDRTKIAEVRAE